MITSAISTVPHSRFSPPCVISAKQESRYPQCISPAASPPEPLATGAFTSVFVQYVLVPPNRNKKVQKKSYSRPYNDLSQKMSLRFRSFSIKSCMSPLLGGDVFLRVAERRQIEYHNVRPAVLVEKMERPIVLSEEKLTCSALILSLDRSKAPCIIQGPGSGMWFL